MSVIYQLIFREHRFGTWPGLSAGSPHQLSLPAVARRRSLFEDRPVEVQQLAGAVRADLAALNRQLGRLQTLGGAAAGRHVQTFSGGVLLALQSRLASMSTRLRDALEVRKQVRGISAC